MSRYKKASIGLVFLVLVWVMFFLILFFLNFVNVKDILSYKSDVNVFIEVNDKGTKLYTILSGEANGTKHMVVLGSSAAANKPMLFDTFLKSTVQGIAKSNQETNYYIKSWSNDDVLYTLGSGKTDATMKSTITAEIIDNFLGSHDSPMKGIGTCIMEAYKRTGVHPIVIMSVAIHESGWGKSGLASAECDKNYNSGSKTSYNLFGMTEGSGWTGETCRWPTYECYSDSQAKDSITRECTTDEKNSRCASDNFCYMELRTFRRYLSTCDSVNDFATMISTASRYSEAMRFSKRPDIMIREIGKAGYASDSGWITKVTSYMESFLKEYPYALIDEEGVWADIPLPNGEKGRVELVI